MNYEHIDKRFTHNLIVDSLITQGDHDVVMQLTYALHSTRVEDGAVTVSSSRLCHLHTADSSSEPAIAYSDLTEEVCCEWAKQFDSRGVSEALKQNLMHFLVPAKPEVVQTVRRPVWAE